MVWFDHLDGMQITDDNISAMAKKLAAKVVDIYSAEGEDPFSSKHILVSTNRGDLILSVGDWISYDRFGRLRIMRIHEAGLENLRPITNADDNTTLNKER